MEFGYTQMWNEHDFKKVLVVVGLKSDIKRLQDRHLSNQYIYNNLGRIRSTVSEHQCHTPSRKERRFLYFNHLYKEFLEQMIPHLKALI